MQFNTKFQRRLNIFSISLHPYQCWGLGILGLFFVCLILNVFADMFLLDGAQVRLNLGTKLAVAELP